MLLFFIFILLFFLNFVQPKPNLPTIPSKSEFILNDMKTFIAAFKEDLIKFVEKLGKIVGKKSLQEMGHPFVEALIRKEFLLEFQKMMKNVKEYSTKANGNFEEIVAELNKLKLAEGKLNALKKLKEEIPIGGNIQKKIADGIPREIPGEISNEKRLELVNQLISLNDSANKFMDKTKLELQIGISQNNFNEFGKLIQENAKKLEGKFGEIFEENKENGFQQIFNIILAKKKKLNNDLEKILPKFDEIEKKLAEDESNQFKKKLLQILRKDMGTLKDTISEENPILETVELYEYPAEFPRYIDKIGVDELVYNFKEIRSFIDDAVDGLPKLIEDGPFFQNIQQQEYANFRQFQWLNNANNEMFHRISLLGGNDPKLVEDYHLADIRYLVEFIQEKLKEINLKSGNKKIVDMKGKKHFIDELEEIILNIAKNLLAISERLEKIRKIDEAINRVINPSDGREKVRRMIEAKTVPKNVGIFFYSKYKAIDRKERLKKKLMEKPIKNAEKMPLRKTMSGRGHNDEKLMLENIDKPKTWPQSGKSKQLDETKVEETMKEHAKERIGELAEIGGNVRPNFTEEEKAEWITVRKYENLKDASKLPKSNIEQFEHPKGLLKLANKRKIAGESNLAKKKGKMVMEIPKNILENSKGIKTNENSLKMKDAGDVESDEILLKSGDIGAKKLSHSKMENIVEIHGTNSKDNDEVEGEEIVYKSGDKMAGSNSPKNAKENVKKDAEPSSEHSEEILWGPNSFKSKHLHVKNTGILVN